MILLAENNDSDAELILRTLQQQVPANSIRHARDGIEAIELLKQWHGEPAQLILLNVNLPGISGLDVLKHVRASRQTSHVPVVMLINSDDSNDIARSYDLGANSLLSKSDRGTSFAETVSQIVPYWLELNHSYIQPGSQH
jgi:two-component system response regulator